jgi:hypothetical protein
MKRISNNRVGYHIQTRSEFQTHTGSMYGQKLGDNGFVVYSYGPHWPLALWNGRFWLLNTERSSVTTNRHNTITRLACPDWVGCPKIELEHAIKRMYREVSA